jgi:alpha-2-macroglobulin
MGRALLASQDKRLSGTLQVGGDSTEVAATSLFGRRFDAAELARGVRFEPRGTPPLFASIEVAGVPREAPPADFGTLKVERRWYGTDGRPWTPGPLAEGEALIVGVEITADVDMPDALLTDLLPAGLEIENFNLGDARQWSDVVVDGIAISERASAAEIRHEEFRDDRYVAALKLSRGSRARLFYLVRAVSPGTYTAPPPLVEDMYRPQLRGVGRAVPATITVVQP